MLALDGLPVDDGVVRIRPFRKADATALVRASRDPLIQRWTFVPADLTPGRARAWLERTEETRRRGAGLRLAVAEANDDGSLLGQVGIGRFDWENGRGEIFYWVDTPARGRGVATRAVRLLVPWAFAHLGLARIEIVTDPANVASQRVAAAAGFTREGLLRSYQWFKDTRMDAVMFSVLPGDEAGARPASHTAGDHGSHTAGDHGSPRLG